MQTSISFENKTIYKKSHVGFIPDNWKVKPLKKIAKIVTGKKDTQNKIEDGEYPFFVRSQTIERIDSYSFDGEAILTAGDGVGVGKVFHYVNEKFDFHQRVYKLSNFKEVHGRFLYEYFRKNFLREVTKFNAKASVDSVRLDMIAGMFIPLPPLPEQRAIAAVLGTWDQGIDTLQRLIAAKQRHKKALMQQLLTGKKRFAEFGEGQGSIKTKYGTVPKDWAYVSLHKIAKEVSEKNKDGDNLPVLSCTKYRGLVDSLEYFGKQIFSKDTSTYKVVKRGQFAYATNHIEEGSIGYQNLYDEALISPMYTAFVTNSKVNDDFLYRLLKTDLFIHIYQASTSASVDRRGSLRWKEFSKIKIGLPSIKEQNKISVVLQAADRALETLERKLAALQAQKKGLMQQLLTGKVRVKTKTNE